MQSVLNFSNIRRVLFLGLGALIVLRSAPAHDWLAVAGGLFVIGYGWFVRG